MADTYTTNLNLTKPEPGAAEDTWGISLNSDLDTLDAIFSSSGTQINLNPNQVNFADNKKAIFGTGSDLKIYHDGSNSYIQDSGTGNLRIAGQSVDILNPDANEFKARFLDNGAAELYYDNSKKLATTSTGIDVTGTVTSDGLTVDGADVFFNSGWIKSNSSLRIDIDNDNNQTDRAFFISHGNASKDIFKASENGDISFYDDTGTTQGLFWDASAESLGLGTTSPSTTLELSNASTAPILRLSNENNAITAGADLGVIEFYSGDDSGGGDAVKASISAIQPATSPVSGELVFNTSLSSGSLTTAMTIDSSQRVGIGTSSPSYLLDVESSSTGNITLAQFKTNESTYNGLLIAANNNAGWIGNGTLVADEGILFQDTSSAMRFYTASSEVGRFDSSGNFGIGTASPSQKLTVEGNIELGTGGYIYGDTTTPSLRLSNSAGSQLIYGTGILSVAPSFTYSGGGSERFRVTDTGFVGIGTSSPSAGLQVAKGSSTIPTAGASTSSACFGNDTSDDNYGVVLGANSSGVGYISSQRTDGTATTYNLAIQPNGGNVGIGTASPSAKLDVSATSGSSVQIKNTGTAASLLLAIDSSQNSIYSRGATASTARDLRFIQGSSEAMRIASDGNVGIGAAPSTHTLEVWRSGGDHLLLGRAGVGTYELGVSTDNALTFEDGGSEKMRLTSTGLGIGTTSPQGNLHVEGAAGVSGGGIIYVTDADNGSTASDALQISKSGDTAFIYNREASGNLQLGAGGNANHMIVRTDGKVGIGILSPAEVLHIQTANDTKLRITKTGTDSIYAGVNTSPFIQASSLRFMSDSSTERARIDSSGNLLVGQTSTALPGAGNTTTGISVSGQYDAIFASRASGVPIVLNRNTDDGDIAQFRKDGTTVGSIGIQSSGLVIDGEVNHTGLRFTSAGITPRLNGAESDNTVDLGESGIRFKDLHLSGTANVGEINIKSGASVVGSIEAATNTNTDISVGSDDIRLLFFTNGSAIIPRAANNGGADNTIDLGGGSNRFQDIYATNGTIQTSDINEKQDIEELSEAETRVAVAAKGLLKKYRWKSAVADKGDDARIHFGIMAQDLQQAFSAEGLDAGDYGMFISSTWTDETTGEEKTRLGVRYNELLAFIIAAI